jgi:hypothetical protein
MYASASNDQGPTLTSLENPFYRWFQEASAEDKPQELQSLLTQAWARKDRYTESPPASLLEDHFQSSTAQEREKSVLEMAQAYMERRRNQEINEYHQRKAEFYNDPDVVATLDQKAREAEEDWNAAYSDKTLPVGANPNAQWEYLGLGDASTNWPPKNGWGKRLRDALATPLSDLSTRFASFLHNSLPNPTE